MKQFENEFGGQTFCLRGADRIDDLPQSMRCLILPHVEDAFADPRHFFEGLAKRTQLSNLASYLRKLTSNNDWQLVYCSNNHAGMISHETGDVVEYDSISECCEWIFEQLLAGSPPEFNWRAIRSDDDDESDPPFQLRLRSPDESFPLLT